MITDVATLNAIAPAAANSRVVARLYQGFRTAVLAARRRAPIRFGRDEGTISPLKHDGSLPDSSLSWAYGPGERFVAQRYRIFTYCAGAPRGPAETSKVKPRPGLRSNRQ
ncbi:hypothetical protein Airi01_095800 [Actinoallomurus iriomotensis]|uniref:Uncharacterized protein n=1 Tax=Actinoallomurus iriomotensis TaxID=478107 RepID=A0A9W6RTA1_9ACTN|nr:hypothetical protein Airi01_095800 [Actinoallomurus iriomotensis]